MITLSSGFLAPFMGAIALIASFLTSEPIIGATAPERLVAASIQRAIADAVRKAMPAAEAAVTAASATMVLELAKAAKPQRRQDR